MVGCAIEKCRNRSESKTPGITFHRFPKDPYKRNEWARHMGIQQWAPTHNDRVCSDHFKKEFLYKTSANVRLLDGAFPSISSHEKEIHIERDDSISDPFVIECTPSLFDGESDDFTYRSSESELVEEVILRKQLREEMTKSRKRSKKLSKLGQALRRCKSKLFSLYEKVEDLKEKNLDFEGLLLENMNGITPEILQQMVEDESIKPRRRITKYRKRNNKPIFQLSI